MRVECGCRLLFIIKAFVFLCDFVVSEWRLAFCCLYINVVETAGLSAIKRERAVVSGKYLGI